MDDINKKRALSMLALARKAGKVVTGEENCEKAIREGYAHLVLVAADASGNTQKKFKNKTKFYNATLIDLFTKNEISSHTGLHNRSTIVITDQNFAKTLIEIMNRSSI